jgi:hypothetical protein
MTHEVIRHRVTREAFMARSSVTVADDAWAVPDDDVAIARGVADRGGVARGRQRLSLGVGDSVSS